MNPSSENKIFQIFYNDQTKKDNDPGFLPLDNLENSRPDWSEYWPIRNYLLSSELAPDAYHGFLSPKFRQKTGLESAAVHEFLNTCDQDVVTFSPFFDQSAFPLNIFEQAVANHPGIHEALTGGIGHIDPGANLQGLVMSSRETIFCNYFAAKPAFWKAWLAQCEKLFAVCEENASHLAAQLNAPVSHSGATNPAKVFMIERVASYLLATQPHWRVRNYNPMALPYAQSGVAAFKRELCELDALKMAYRQTGFGDYLAAFSEVRSDIVRRLQS